MNDAICGILLIDKSKGWTSHDVVSYIRGAMKTKTGHSGTLDPMASGLLIILLGRATKLQEKYQKTPKTYLVETTLGTETDTWDAEGSIVRTAPVKDFTMEDIVGALGQMSGVIKHPVPFYSAKKVGGVAMYKSARRGNNIFKESIVEIFKWEYISISEDKKINFKVTCGSGTYARSLAYMLAQKLGTVGHISSLRRIEAGGFNVKDALNIEEVKKMTREDILKCVKTL
ncbi:MAG: tRNA pseudouridine(55) synthase TruB [Elusimicrobiota bacterium]|jgi:tRNA pseudouridine55 synthase|nr:tRNA pseudouridine(55) synthase TruB [Elusimicrobiota bacterium]